MKKFLLIFTTSLVFSSLSRADAISLSSVDETFSKALVDIRATTQEKAQRARLDLLKKDLEEQRSALRPKNKSPEKKIHLKLSRYLNFLEAIDVTVLNKEQCLKNKDALIHSYNPQEKASITIPFEAQKVLELLATLCKNPNLTEIPTSFSE